MKPTKTKEKAIETKREIKVVDTLLKDVATIKEAFIIDELQKYMDLSNPSIPKWIEPVRLRLLEKEDWKRITKGVMDALYDSIINEKGFTLDLFKDAEKELGLDK